MGNAKKIKTRLPAVLQNNKARIKRIMRTDEDVGKVSQATPVLIAKALESFLEALVQKSVQEAEQKQAKKLTIAHVYW
jgi:histone H3/H4